MMLWVTIRKVDILPGLATTHDTHAPQIQTLAYQAETRLPLLSVLWNI
jgi:hypothetical protein